MFVTEINRRDRHWQKLYANKYARMVKLVDDQFIANLKGLAE